MYDPRVERWFAPDKLERKYPMLSTYAGFANNPMFYVDLDGNENIIYIVNVPDSKGKKTISDAELQRRINKANIVLSSKADVGGYELNTRFVLFNPDSNKKRGNFNRKQMDNTDGVILMGNSEDIKRYDRQNHVTGMSEEKKRAGDKGWVPFRNNDDGSVSDNPENTSQGSIVGGWIDTKTTDFDEQVLLMFHSAGHMNKNPIKIDGVPFDDHIGDSDNPNIMMDGDSRGAYLRHGKKHKNSDLLTSKLPINTSGFKNRMLKFFGSKKAEDNYDKKIKK